VTYPSRRFSVQQLADSTLPAIVSEAGSNRVGKIHFVTHSLGGILLRQYLADHSVENLGRVVMLGPPNHGSEVVDHLDHLAPGRWVLGPAGRELGTGPEDPPNQLGPVAFDCGVIAGDRSHNFLFSLWLPGPDDGKVSVESTKVT